MCCGTEHITITSWSEKFNSETNFLFLCKTAILFKEPGLANCDCGLSGGLILISSCLWHMHATGLKNSAKALICLMKRSFVCFRVALPQDRDFWHEDFNQNNCLIIKSLILFLCNEIYKKWKNMITCSNENESYFLIVCLYFNYHNKSICLKLIYIYTHTEIFLILQKHF